MTTRHGIDLSHWNSGVRLADTDAQFAVFKLTDGTNFVDEMCDDFVDQAQVAQIQWGTYHFAQVGGTAEADYYVKHAGSYVGHGVLVLDWEADAVERGTGAAKAWLDRVFDSTGVRPMIYMSQSTTTRFDWSAVKAHYPLWVARYGDSYGDTGAWVEPIMWQYTDAHKTGGYAVDGDYFYGTSGDWSTLAKAGGSVPADDDPPKVKQMSYGGDQ